MAKTNSICSVDGCNKPVHVKLRGWCSKHYGRWKRHGNPLSGGTESGAPMAFLEKVLLAHTDACIPWPFARRADGASHMAYKGRHTTASRVLLMLKTGRAPDSKTYAAHTCGNGHEACVNPRHLYWATPTENSHDRRKHGTEPYGETHHSAKLTEDQAKAILKDTRSNRVTAKAYGVHAQTIQDIRSGRNWKHLKRERDNVLG